jgi:hypothetical protein
MGLRDSHTPVITYYINQQEEETSGIIEESMHRLLTLFPPESGHTEEMPS